MAINFAAASTAGLNNPETEIITLVKDGGGNFINPPSYDKMRAYLSSGDVPSLFVTDESGKTGDIYQFSGYSETENKIRFSNDKTTIEFSAGASAPVVSDVVPKPLTYDYMPEGYPKKTVQAAVLMAEQELAFASSQQGAYRSPISENLPEIVAGQTYAVKWDGTEYECVCVTSQKFLMLGNLSIAGNGDDTGEPFIYSYDINGGRGMFATLDTAASHTISVKKIEETVTPMVEEFLPASALITYDLSTTTYSSNFTNDELHARLLDGKQIVLYETDSNEYLYLTKWTKIPSGRIDLAFGGSGYSVSLNTDGTIVNKPIS